MRKEHLIHTQIEIQFQFHAMQRDSLLFQTFRSSRKVHFSKYHLFLMRASNQELKLLI